MNLEFSDPLDPFRSAFSKLLGPKALHSADIQNQRLLYEEGGETRDINSLSSGEREVLNITFDFILRQPSHCIVFFDEPELHLHPELLSRLIDTIRTVGEGNQFILISHSPDVIASSLNDSVVFLTPPKVAGENQAVLLDAKGETTEALHRLGQSVGVVSLGKKIVLIEGTEASLDKQTYSVLLRNRFPNLVLLPSGGKGNLQAFSRLATEVLDKTLWGIKFYMLADRDAAPAHSSSRAKNNFRTLSRYHLENYFLEEDILALCFDEMEPPDSWLRSPDKIAPELRAIARSDLGYATSLVVTKLLRDAVGNIDTMPKAVHKMDRDDLAEAFRLASENERLRVTAGLEEKRVTEIARETHDRLLALVNDPSDNWKTEFPGKLVLSKFCAKAGIPEGRLKSLYLTKTQKLHSAPFLEIIDIFKSFSED